MWHRPPSLAGFYRISAPGCDQVYVGSTRKTLSARLMAHQQGMRVWERGMSAYVTSYLLVGRPGVTIDLIEEEEYQDIQHMRDREAYWIERIPTVNRNVPGRSQAESARVSKAMRVPCSTCGKIVRRSDHWKHQLSRKCMVAAFNRPRSFSNS